MLERSDSQTGRLDALNAERVQAGREYVRLMNEGKADEAKSQLEAAIENFDSQVAELGMEPASPVQDKESKIVSILDQRKEPLLEDIQNPAERNFIKRTVESSLPEEQDYKDLSEEAIAGMITAAKDVYRKREEKAAQQKSNVRNPWTGTPGSGGE